MDKFEIDEEVIVIATGETAIILSLRLGKDIPDIYSVRAFPSIIYYETRNAWTSAEGLRKKKPPEVSWEELQDAMNWHPNKQTVT